MTQDEMIEKLIMYLKMKVEQRDWHGVSDAANDLRVLEAQKIRLELPPAATRIALDGLRDIKY